MDMIKLENINKYYYKNRANSIHVIDNTSIEFPEVGLVSITGPSGCGKTTLLNIIGGLDKFDSGKIIFDFKEITKYHPYDWDKLRNKYIGYIFQNYNLISDKTVFENVAMALNLSGLYDSDEIEKRVNYVLQTVGMYNYRKRNVKALSGGQQQRVAIARAIAKNPKVVLADEPTGNLDSNNTFEIMSIIKKISQTRLVILVSHERDLVDFYSDRVLELSDGKIINDISHSGNRSLSRVDERNIYLKDLNKDESLEAYKIQRYYDQDKDEDLEMKIIEMRDSIYVKVYSKKKVKFLTDDTEIRLVNDHYKERKSEDIDNLDFDLHQFGEITGSDKRLSFIKLWDTIKQGFKKTLSRKKFFGRILMFAYFIISAIVVYQIATLGNLTNIEPKDYLVTGKNLISINTNELEENLDRAYIDSMLASTDDLEFVPYFAQIQMDFRLGTFYQGNIYTDVNAFPMKASWIKDTDIIYGRMPQGDREIVIDKLTAESLLEEKQLSDVNITKINELIDGYLQTNGRNILRFRIVGICDTDSPIMVVPDDYYYSFVDFPYSFLENDVAKDRINIIQGRGIQADDEVLISEDNTDLNLNDDYIYNSQHYKVVGVYNFKDDENESYYGRYVFPAALVSDIAKDRAQILQDYYSSMFYTGVFFHANDVKTTISELNAKSYPVYDAYANQRDSYIERINSQNASQIETIIIVFAGIIIYIFFIMRSSMLNRIKEIGIYRSIGASKLDIYKIFLGEILAFTTIGSLTGYLLMAFLIMRIQKLLGDLTTIFYLPIHYFLGGIIAIYLLNVIFGMIPIFTLLRKTPSEIVSKYDI